MEKSTTIRCSSLTVAATGVHRFTVDGYSIAQQLATVDSGLFPGYYQSSEFAVGGHGWAIRCYPTPLGSCEFFLVMLSTPASGSPVGATLACTPLDRRGEPSAGEERRRSQVFGLGGGQQMLCPIRFGKEVMQSAEYVARDCFAVQCTVSVLKKPLC